MIETKQAIKLAQAVASWSDEEREQILAMADALQAAASSTAPEVKKRGPKPKAVAAVSGEVKPKRKYTKRVKVAPAEAEVVSAAS